jgi:dimethylargininase
LTHTIKSSCCFVEDTCVVLGDTALINRIGHASRRGEVAGIAEALKCHPLIKRVVEMQEPATLDGGDVLYTGRHIFVGISQRTNQQGIDMLRQVRAEY